MTRVVFPDCTPHLAAYYDDEMRQLLPQLELDVAKPAPDALVARLRGVAAALNFSVVFTRPIIEACPDLRIIVFLGTGVGNWVDLAAAKERGIRVRNILNYGDRTIAEHTLALLFDAVRRVALMDRRIRAGVWRYDAMYELEGKTIGLIGLGGIGRTMAQLCSAIGLKVIGWNRSPVPADVPCTMVPLDDVLAKADIVSLHLGLNDETRGIIDARRLGLMKPGAVFLNTARGALVDEAALIDALGRGHIRHAGLDVFHAEPLKPDHPLARMENVTITAHAGFRTREASETLMRRAIDIVKRIVG